MKAIRAFHRLYSTEAAASAVSSATSTAAPAAAPTNILAGLILSRIPIVTKELTEFEKAYYNYQDELERRLMWTFPQFYYFKRGTLAERRFVEAQKRGPVHYHPDIWFSRGKPNVRFNRDRSSKQEIVIPVAGSSGSGGEKKEDSFSSRIVETPRITEADRSGKTDTLERKLDRTLYLIIKDPVSGTWRFPSFNLQPREPLHVAAERGIREIGGPDMNTWVVSNTPSAVIRYSQDDKKKVPISSGNDSTIREFFIKSHILHGVFAPVSKSTEFAWLTKDEFKDRADEQYFKSIEAVLSNQ